MTMKLLTALEAAGWRVETFEERRAVPLAVRERYPWIPGELLEAIESIELATSPDEKAWLLSSSDYADSSNSAFAWDEFEQQSLEAAADDPVQQRDVAAFWPRHFPFLLSVRNGYAYFAIAKGEGVVVRGVEPEYEATTQVAASLEDFLEKVRVRDPIVVNWI